MGFFRKLFGGSGERVVDRRGLDQNRIDEIVMVVGTRRISCEDSDGKTLYSMINPGWSGKHRVTVIQTATEVAPGPDGYASCLKRCLEHKSIPPNSTLVVQPLTENSIAFCLCTFLDGIHPDADKSQVVTIVCPIPFR